MKTLLKHTSDNLTGSILLMSGTKVWVYIESWFSSSLMNG